MAKPDQIDANWNEISANWKEITAFWIEMHSFSGAVAPFLKEYRGQIEVPLPRDGWIADRT